MKSQGRGPSWLHFVGLGQRLQEVRPPPAVVVVSGVFLVHANVTRRLSVNDLDIWNTRNNQSPHVDVIWKLIPGLHDGGCVRSSERRRVGRIHTLWFRSTFGNRQPTPKS